MERAEHTFHTRHDFTPVLGWAAFQLLAASGADGAGDGGGGGGGGGAGAGRPSPGLADGAAVGPAETVAVDGGDRAPRALRGAGRPLGGGPRLGGLGGAVRAGILRRGPLPLRV